MKVGTTVKHKDKLGPKGLGEIVRSDQWSVVVHWIESKRTAVYHPRILQVVEDK